MSEIDPDLLLRAYSIGVFPMADSRDAADIYWVEPKRRGIMPLDGFHLSRSLSKRLRSGRYRLTVDLAFDRVLAACAAETERRPETWINGPIERAYRELARRKQAHSLEVWRGEALVGGLYGVVLGRAFFGESMFSTASDASKVAFAHLVARLRYGGYRLLDCQFITDHLASLGAIEIDRKTYAGLLGAALGAGGASNGTAAGDATAFPPSGAAAGDFFALDRVGTIDDAAIVSGPVSACRIVQALVQTSYTGSWTALRPGLSL